MENNNSLPLEKVISLYLKHIYIDVRNASQTLLFFYIYKGDTVIGWVEGETTDNYLIHLDQSLQQQFLDLFGVKKHGYDLGEYNNFREITFTIKEVLMDKINTYFLSDENRVLMNHTNTYITWYDRYHRALKFGNRINLY